MAKKIILFVIFSAFRSYTKTDLVFGFSENQILVARPNGLGRAGSYPRTKGAEDFTRAK
jgi:hypothetical protein